jgi:hypothetical protein
METALNFNPPLTFLQVAEIVKQLPKPEKAKLAKLLQSEVKQKNKNVIETHFASQSVLAKDWLNPEEDLAWQHL